jgi:hypothetical protein
VFDAKPNVILCYPRSGFIDQFSVIIGEHDARCNLRSPRPSERVRQFFTEAHTHCFPAYGLIRRKVLGKTSLLPPYISSDQILLLQLALQGEFYEIPERLFFFREHPERSVWQYKSFAGYATWHDPRRKSRIQLPRWRLAVEFLRSIAGANIQWREAAACYVLVMKWCWWIRYAMVRDLVMGGRQITARMLGLPPIADMKSAIAVKGAAGFDDDDDSARSSVARNASKETEKA